MFERFLRGLTGLVERFAGTFEELAVFCSILFECLMRFLHVC